MLEVLSLGACIVLRQARVSEQLALPLGTVYWVNVSANSCNHTSVMRTGRVRATAWSGSVLQWRGYVYVYFITESLIPKFRGKVSQISRQIVRKISWFCGICAEIEDNCALILMEESVHIIVYANKTIERIFRARTREGENGRTNRGP